MGTASSVCLPVLFVGFVSFLSRKWSESNVLQTTSMRILRMFQAILFNDIKLIYTHLPIHPPTHFYLFIYLVYKALLARRPLKKAKRKDEGKYKLTHLLAAY